MSVFTIITNQELGGILKCFGLKPATSYQPIAQGTVNSNYDVTTADGHFVLTILEAMEQPLADKILAYNAYLANSNIPCPQVIKTVDNNWTALWQHKPVAMTSFIQAQMISKPSAKLCHHLGKVLAKLHVAGQHYPEQIPNQMGFAWQQQAYAKLPNKIQAELAQTLSIQEAFASLPKGMIHFDCFRDNVFVEGDKVKGIIDFYYACYDYLLIDIAVCINDWCTNWDSSTLIPDKYQQFLSGYQSIRPLTTQETNTLPQALTLMAAHFWMSRTLTLSEAKQGEGLFEKDPLPFKKLWEHYQAGLAYFPAAFAK